MKMYSKFVFRKFLNMKIKGWVSLICFILLCSCIENRNAQMSSAYALIGQMNPSYSDQFKLKLIEPKNGGDVYEIAAGHRKVIL